MENIMSECQLDQQAETAVGKARIMIVDDNVEFLEELENLLKLGGYDVMCSSDGPQVFGAALRYKPDLILLDLKMSPKSGFQIADELKSSLLLKDVPVIAMTGFYTESEHFLMMQLSGIKTTILKPIRLRSLINSIESALGDRLDGYNGDGV